MSNREHHEVIRRHVMAETARRMEETLATLAPDCVFDDRTLRRVFHGREGAAQYYRMWWQAFENVVQVDQSHWTRDDRVIAEVRFQGTHRGTFLGIPATGRSVDLPIVIIVTGFRDGLMAGERLYWDLGTLCSQLGVASLPDVTSGVS